MEIGQRLVDALIERGIRRVFGLPGGQTASFYNGLARRRGEIEHVLMRDERSASFAADAYARVTGVVGVCDATVGPGATNLVSGLAEASASSIPVLAIVPDIPRNWERRRHRGSASQGIEQRDFLSGCVKWFGRVNVPDELEQVLDQCVRVATSGRPGPVVLEIPLDVMTAEAAPRPPAYSPLLARFPRLRTAPDPESIRAAADALLASRMPIVLVGGGGHISGAYDEIVEVAEAHDIPVVTTISGKGMISEVHRLALGVCGGFGSDAANNALCRADCVLVVGSKLGQLTTLDWTMPRPDATVVHIDVDGSEIGRNFSRTVGVESDATLALRALLEALRGCEIEHEWNIEALQGSIDESWATDVFRGSPETDCVKPQELMRVVGGLVGDDDVVVTDASLSSGWGCSRWRVRREGRRFLAPRGVAGLGWGLPAAIGASLGLSDLGRPGRVICIAGDGGWGYSVADTEVLSRLGIPVLAIILNNSSLAWNKHALTGMYEGVYVSQDFAPVNWAAAAEAFGVRGVRITSAQDLAPKLEYAFADCRKPTVVDVVSSDIESPWISADPAVGDAVTPY